jgi:hypothetical protein
MWLNIDGREGKSTYRLNINLDGTVSPTTTPELIDTSRKSLAMRRVARPLARGGLVEADDHKRVSHDSIVGPRPYSHSIVPGGFDVTS